MEITSIRRIPNGVRTIKAITTISSRTIIKIMTREVITITITIATHSRIISDGELVIVAVLKAPIMATSIAVISTMMAMAQSSITTGVVDLMETLIMVIVTIHGSIIIRESPDLILVRIMVPMERVSMRMTSPRRLLHLQLPMLVDGSRT